MGSLLFERLNELKIQTQTYDHISLYTVEEALRVANSISATQGLQLSAFTLWTSGVSQYNDYYKF